MATIAAVPAVSSSMPVIPYTVISAADPTALTRKRRRDIDGSTFGAGAQDDIPDEALSYKIAKMEPTAAAEAYPVVSAPLLVATVAQPIITVRQTEGAKRPQMKYDPSVPMTKEETSAWRREQRRKRNRESAAACRRRQRDRISELEDEVSDWKGKFDDALRRLKEADGGVDTGELRSQLEVMFAIEHLQQQPSTKTTAMECSSSRCMTPPNVCPEAVMSSMTIPASSVQRSSAGPEQLQSSHIISPNEQRPKFIPPLTVSSEEDDLHFPVLEEEDLLIKNNNNGIPIPADAMNPRVENRQHLKLITRPAVKIAGAVHTPLVNIESVCDDLLQVVPESCLSLTEKKTMPFPETCPSLVTTPVLDPILMGPASVAASMAAAAADVLMGSSESIPGVSGTDESDEDSDLGEFLLDAVQWL